MELDILLLLDEMLDNIPASVSREYTDVYILRDTPKEGTTRHLKLVWEFYHNEKIYRYVGILEEPAFTDYKAIIKNYKTDMEGHTRCKH